MAGIIPQIGFRLAISRRYRNRYREITNALLKHGFGFLITQLGLTRFLPFRIITFGHPKELEAYTQAEHVRMFFEDLGTTFIKLGQVLSTRVDLISPEYISELEKLLDQVPPAGVDFIRASIEHELGRKTDDIFSYFDPEPLASASIGQVHAATLKTGEDVVVKVKRPGVQEQVKIDVEIITELARLANKRLPIAQTYDFEGIAREFTHTLLRELDYMLEGRNADRLRENFKGDDRAYIPKIYWDYTTSSVLVMERITGIRINDRASMIRAGIDPAAVAKTSADILLKQVIEQGFFHADPHPANFFVMSEKTIGIVDFGMVGYLDQETKTGLVELFLAVFDQDPDEIIDSYIDLGVIGRIERMSELRSDISTLIAQYYGLSLGEVDLKSILYDSTSLIRRHNLRMPANLALLVKTVWMEESLVLQLDPSFNFAEETKPFARRLWEQTYSPYALANRAFRALGEFAIIGTRAPRQLRRILGQVSRGELSIVTNQPRLDEELSTLNRMVNKLILGIISSATIIFAGLFISFYHTLIEERRARRGAPGTPPLE